MVPFKVTYGTAGITTMMPTRMTILGATEEGVACMFENDMPDSYVTQIERDDTHHYSLNGRYSIYFRGKA